MKSLTKFNRIVLGALAVAGLLALAPNASAATAPTTTANPANLGTQMASTESSLKSKIAAYAAMANKNSPEAKALLKDVSNDLKFLQKLVKYSKALKPTDPTYQERCNLYEATAKDIQADVDALQASGADAKKLQKIIEKTNKAIVTGNQIFPDCAVSPVS